MEVWNPILWEFSRVMRECHRKVGAMLGKDRPPVSNGPIMGALRAQDGLVQEGYVTLEGEEGKSALHLTTAGQAEAARMGRAMEETEKLALQDFTVEDIAQLHSLLERMHRNLEGKGPSGEQKPRLEY